jgi:hypothetical protein
MLFFKILLGIIIIVLLIIGIILGTGYMIFNKYIAREIDQLADLSGGGLPPIFTYDDLEGLPEPVETYFKYALRNGQEDVQFARLKQTGVFKSQEAGEWNYMEAEQYFATEDPAFVWFARMRAAPLIWIGAMDTYSGGKGNMIIKFFSALTVRSATSKEINISEMVRYFAEAPWFPTALLPSSYVEWEELDNTRARVTLTAHGLSATGVFHFNERGQIEKFVTYDRYRESGGRYYREQWTGYYKDYKEFAGMRIPTKVEAEWNLENWDFKYISVSLKDVQYDTPTRFER